MSRGTHILKLICSAALLTAASISVAGVSIPSIGVINFHTITLFSAYRTDSIYQYPFDISETASNKSVQITASASPNCNGTNAHSQCLANTYDSSQKIYYTAEYFSCANSLGGIKDIYLTHSGSSTVTDTLLPSQLNCSTIHGQLDFTRLAKTQGPSGLTPIMAGPYSGSLALTVSEV